MRDLAPAPGSSSRAHPAALWDPQALPGPTPDGAPSALFGGKNDGAALLLFVGSPREILARIVPGDPLGLRPRLASLLRRRAVFADAERVLLRAFARVARGALSWRGRPDLDPWLDARVAEALDEILEEEAADLEVSEANASPPLASPTASPIGAWAQLAAPLGLDPETMRRACARFHRLDPEDREAFFLVAIDGLSPDAACARTGVSLTRLARRARRALSVFRPSPSPPPPRAPGPAAGPSATGFAP